MSPRLRTPRQTPGEALIELSVSVPPATKDALLALAAEDRRSLSNVARVALEAYVDARERERDTDAGE